MIHIHDGAFHTHLFPRLQEGISGDMLAIIYIYTHTCFHLGLINGIYRRVPRHFPKDKVTKQPQELLILGRLGRTAARDPTEIFQLDSRRCTWPTFR